MGRLRRLINFAAPAILAGALFTAGSGNMQAACNLNSSGGQIKRVIYITFDNATLFGAGSKEDIAVKAALPLPDAFGKFFARLAADGFTKDNTLFVIVPDENWVIESPRT